MAAPASDRDGGREDRTGADTEQLARLFVTRARFDHVQQPHGNVDGDGDAIGTLPAQGRDLLEGLDELQLHVRDIRGVTVAERGQPSATRSIDTDGEQLSH